MLEFASGNNLNESDARHVIQAIFVLIYRFGANENINLAGRYNIVIGDNFTGETMEDSDINRFKFSGGWFMAKNVLIKAEYMIQNYDGFFGPFAGAELNEINIEAVVSF